jgi:hypothetical protein
MAQRPGRGDDRSDLDDVKALAVKARSETGGPVPRPNPSDLSGVRPRRDSVVGMRLTPPPRATGGDLPNWLWGVLGCLTVLLVGFGGLFVLGRSGKLGPLLGEAASLMGPAPAAPAAAPEPVAAAKPPEDIVPVDHPAAAEHARPEHDHEHLHAHGGHAAPTAEAEPGAAAAPAPAPTGEAEPSAAAPADNAPVAAADDSAAKRAARPAKAKAAKAEAPDDDSAPAAAPKAADDSDDDSSLPGQDDVERALDALAPRVRGCFVKYQIKGTARVRLVATAAGKAESVNVTGDFEDTPTGNCVESILSEAKLPTFKGPPLKLSQSYQLR